MKKVVISILISLILILGLVIFHNTLYDFYPINRKSIAFGITLYYSWIIFTILILGYNIYLEFNNKNKYAIGLILFSISVILPLDFLEYRPFRTLLLIILIFLGFIFSMIINQIRRQKLIENQSEHFWAKNRLIFNRQKNLINKNLNIFEPNKKIRFDKIYALKFNKIYFQAKISKVKLIRFVRWKFDKIRFQAKIRIVNISRI